MVGTCLKDIIKQNTAIKTQPKPYETVREIDISCFSCLTMEPALVSEACFYHCKFPVDPVSKDHPALPIPAPSALKPSSELGFTS